MIRKIKKCVIALICFAFLFTSNACWILTSKAPMPYDGNYMDLYTISAFSVIGAEEPGVKISIVEKDDYGRRLYCIQFTNPVFYSYYSNTSMDTMNAYAYGICQKTDSNKVYYYEDICYRVFANQSDFTDEEKEELKSQNDWGQPVNFDRMSYRTIIKRRKYKRTATILADNDRNQSIYDIDVLKIFYEVYYGREMKAPKDEVNYQNMILDVDHNGNVIGVVYKIDQCNDESLSITGWFLFLKPDCKITRTCIIQEIKDIDHYWKELHTFKQVNGWAF